MAQPLITLHLDRATVDLLVRATALAANHTSSAATGMRLDLLGEALSRVLLDARTGKQQDDYRITVQRR